MVLYRFLVQQISGYFEGCEFKHVPRAENGAADILSKLGSSREAIPSDVALEHLTKPSIKPSRKSESIPMPPESSVEAIPMDVHKDKKIVENLNSGTIQSDPGTSQPMEDVVTSDDPIA